MRTAVGLLAGMLTTFAFLPQILEIWREKSAKNVSLKMYLVFTCGVVLWLAYGVAMSSAPVIIANSVTLGLTLTIVVMKVRYSP